VDHTDRNAVAGSRPGFSVSVAVHGQRIDVDESVRMERWNWSNGAMARRKPIPATVVYLACFCNIHAVRLGFWIFRDRADDRFKCAATAYSAADAAADAASHGTAGYRTVCFAICQRRVVRSCIIDCVIPHGACPGRPPSGHFLE
jgi:hypothetical protein